MVLLTPSPTSKKSIESYKTVKQETLVSVLLQRKYEAHNAHTEAKALKDLLQPDQATDAELN